MSGQSEAARRALGAGGGAARAAQSRASGHGWLPSPLRSTARRLPSPARIRPPPAPYEKMRTREAIENLQLIRFSCPHLSMALRPPRPGAHPPGPPRAVRVAAIFVRAAGPPQCLTEPPPLPTVRRPPSQARVCYYFRPFGGGAGPRRPPSRARPGRRLRLIIGGDSAKQLRHASPATVTQL